MTTEIEALYQVVQSRQSIRSFRAQPVPQPVLNRMFMAAIRAPSAHNRQPWRFLVLEDEVSKDKLARRMGERLERERLADGDERHAVQRDVARSYRRIIGAPVVVVVCLTIEEMDRYPDERRMQAEHHMAVQGVAMAAQNFLLAAVAEGLGACWMCAPLFAPEEVQRSMDLPDSWEPQGLILLGYPARPGRIRSRKPLEEVLRFG